MSLKYQEEEEKEYGANKILKKHNGWKFSQFDKKRKGKKSKEAKKTYEPTDIGSLVSLGQDWTLRYLHWYKSESNFWNIQRKNLESCQRGKPPYCRGKQKWIFPQKLWKPKGSGTTFFKCWKDNCQPGNLYPVKISLQNEGGIKTLGNPSHMKVN